LVNVANYISYEYWISEENKVESSNPYTQSLELEFASYSLEELNSKISLFQFYIIWINILNYIILFWAFSMIWVSFYKRELIKNN
jgi:hypothetical protein